MDLIQRNTDYALRLMVNLAVSYPNGCTSAKTLSQEEDVSYPLTCKLLHQLNVAGFVRSTMGLKGGFSLNRLPSKISLLDVIEVIQGTLVVNRCVLNKEACPRQATCPITKKLKGLQDYLAKSLTGITLADLAKTIK